MIESRAVRLTPLADAPDIICGVDAVYADDDSWVLGAAVTLDARSLEVIEQVSIVEDRVEPYVSGRLAFREGLPVLEAIARLKRRPDVVICDGQGIAHPQRFGLACHVGQALDLPTVGCAKSRLIGRYEEPGRARGDWSPLVDGGEIVGQVVRTQDDVRPVFVSPGHLVDVDSAGRLVLAATTRYRLPETTRQADQYARRQAAVERAARAGDAG